MRLWFDKLHVVILNNYREMKKKRENTIYACVICFQFLLALKVSQVHVVPRFRFNVHKN